MMQVWMLAYENKYEMRIQEVEVPRVYDLFQNPELRGERMTPLTPQEMRIRHALQHYESVLQLLRAQKHYPMVLAALREAS